MAQIRVELQRDQSAPSEVCLYKVDFYVFSCITTKTNLIFFTLFHSGRNGQFSQDSGIAYVPFMDQVDDIINSDQFLGSDDFTANCTSDQNPSTSKGRCNLVFSAFRKFELKNTNLLNSIF